MCCTDTAVPVCTLLGHILPAELPPLRRCHFCLHFAPLHYRAVDKPRHLTSHVSRHRWGLTGGGPAVTWHLPPQVSCQRSMPALSSIHISPKQTTPPPKKAPAEQSGPPDLSAERVAGRRHPDQVISVNAAGQPPVYSSRWLGK